MRNLIKISLLGCCSLFWIACTDGKKQTQENSADATDTLFVDAGVKTLKVDQVTVTWIQDNRDDRMMPLSLFPDALPGWTEGLSEGVASTVSAFWVETDTVGILFDAGLGQDDSQLLPRLKSLGVSPEAVKYIYLTHFHGDHIGGLLHNDSVVFPHAHVYAAKQEYDGWMIMPDEKKVQVEKTMEAYKERLHLVNFGDTLPGNVVARSAVGHTPGHTVYQAGKLLVFGDLIHGADLQFDHPEVCASFDMDKEAAVRIRKQYLEEAKEKGYVMAGMHLPAPAFK